MWNVRAALAVLSAMDKEIHDQPSEVSAEHGEVMVDGPDGVAVSLTPDAAAETSRRLLFGAAQARGQQLDEANKADLRR